MAETLDFAPPEVSDKFVTLEGTQMSETKASSLRAEIDTSAPFESVKEAVSRFGGIGYWKPHPNKLSEPEHDMEEVDILKVEEQAAQLEKDLILKERETLEVLKELETTKNVVEDLKLKLQREASEVNVAFNRNKDIIDVEIDENGEGCQNSEAILRPCPSSPPGLILMELKQAKLHLTKTTNDLADIRASVESLNKKLEKERNSLEKARDRLTLNSTRISSLEEELNHTRLKLELAKGELKGGSDDFLDIPSEVRRLSSEAEQFKNLGEAARSEVLRAISEIEQTKTSIKTAEIRLVAARKMKEAARAAEAVALAEISALPNRKDPNGNFVQKPDGVTISFEEYSSLTSRACEAEELLKRKIIDTMAQVDEANVSKIEILKKVEEASQEVKRSKKALEDALNRVEAANTGKLAVEEALRKWRSEHSQKKRYVHNSIKFKNSCPPHHRRDSRLIDVNGLNMTSDGSMPVLKPTLSIGQILSRKLLLPQEFETATHGERSNVKRKMSLGQMLSKQSGDDINSCRKVERESGQKQFPVKRKKSGFARFSLLLTKQSKKKKKPNPNFVNRVGGCH